MKYILLASFYLLFTCHIHGQERCIGSNTDPIVIFAEVLPVSSITLDALESIINGSMNVNDFERPAHDMIYLTFTINCKGEALNYKYLRPVDPKLQARLIGVFTENLSWKPAYQNGRALDFQTTIAIKMEESSFNILDEKDYQKEKKGKKKR